MRLRFCAILFLLLTGLPPVSIRPALAEDQPVGERAILEIVVNGYNEGQQFLRITDDSDVLLSSELLKGLRLRPELWAGQESNQISLRSLTPKLQFSLDTNSAMLNLAVPSEWFKPQIISSREENAVRENATKEVLHPLPWAGFLNYNIQADFSEQEDGLSDLTLPWELGFNYGQWFAQSTFSSRYDVEEQEYQTVRQNTSLLWDDPDTMHSLTLGDFNPPYSLLGGGGNFAGISWRKNFSLDRNFRYDSNLSLTTEIDSPTHAQLYSNGRQVKEWDLLPGMVNFEDISSYVGGDAELVLTDAFGRERRLNVPSFTSQQVLKKGVHEYAYSLGWQRENIGRKSNDYGDPAALGFHRYGFGETWTGGAAFTVTEDSFAAGSMLFALLGGFSQLETGFFVSRSKKNETGYSGTARYSFRYKQFNAYTGLTGFSREYVNVPERSYANDSSEDEGEDEDGENKLRYQGSLNLSYSDTDWGSLSLGYAENVSWNNDSSRSLSLTYRKSLFSGLHLTLGVKHDLEEEDSDSIYLTLQFSPKTESNSRDWYDSLNAESRYHETDGWQNTASLQKTYPRGAGYGYTANLSRKEDEFSGNVRGQYKNAHGIYTAAARYSENSSFSGSLTAAGSLALINKGIYHGRPITDSFAVVQVEGLDDVTVENGSIPMGKAGNDSSLLVPDLNSYNKNRLSIATLNLPLNYNAAVLEQDVEVGQRSGSIVKFQFTRFSAVEGELYLQPVDKDEEKVRIEEALPLELTFNGEKHEGFTGRNGYFYLENVPVGEHTLRVYQPGGYCLAKFTVPDTDKIVVNLGELACVSEKNRDREK
ncbi:MAG: fimbrial biogenesis outer membrane usher protein [Candidatus Electrothrix sp. AU1_5]|nr:fimbrial biogenesis outer membrane usher protein [Candidatus Electrothrix gigas]